jgi:hypothetical protein
MRSRLAAAIAHQATAPVSSGPCLQMRLVAGLSGSRRGRQASREGQHVI